MTLNYVIRKSIGWGEIYEGTRRNQSPYDDGWHQAVWKKNNRIEFDTNIQPEYKDEIWHWNMCHTHNERGEIAERTILPIKKKLECLEERKLICTAKYWNWTSSAEIKKKRHRRTRKPLETKRSRKKCH